MTDSIALKQVIDKVWGDVWHAPKATHPPKAKHAHLLGLAPQRQADCLGFEVDAALSGLDQGELVTIPALPEIADWNAFEAARRALGPNLSLAAPAARYAH